MRCLVDQIFNGFIALVAGRSLFCDYPACHLRMSHLELLPVVSAGDEIADLRMYCHVKHRSRLNNGWSVREPRQSELSCGLLAHTTRQKGNGGPTLIQAL